MYVFAIAPTSDMHLKHLQIALINFVYAKANKKPFVLRIEDAKKSPNEQEKIEEITTLLDFFRLQFEHIYYQSQNVKFYLQFASKLLCEKKAFSCFCDESAKKCTGDCENLSDMEILNNQKPFCIRIKKAKKSISFKDTCKKEFKFSPKNIGDFIIITKDKYPSFTFANSIDDMIQNVSHCIKDETLSLDVPKNLHVKNSLDFKEDMEVCFVKTIPNQDENTKLVFLLEQGFLPQAIINYILTQTFTCKDKIFTLDEFIQCKIPKLNLHVNLKFDMEKLKQINKEHIKNQDDLKLSSMLGYSSIQVGQMAKILSENARTLNELKEKIEPIFTQKQIPNELKEECKKLSNFILTAPNFQNYEEFLKHLLAKSDLEEKKLDKLLHILLTNSQNDIELKKLYPIIKNYFKEIIK